MSTGSSQPAADGYRVPLRTRLLRSLLRALFRFIFRVFGRVRIQGIEHIPASGAYLIVANHVSVFEPPFILAFWPQAPEAIAAVEVWERSGQNILVRLYGSIQVHRGEYDREVIDTMLAVLRAGKALLLFPEGTRSHQPGMRRGLPGAAYLADAAQVPILPVGIVGTHDDLLAQALRGRRPRVEMHIGTTFHLPPISGRGEARRLARQQNADQIMRHIAALLPAEYQGAYAAGQDDAHAPAGGSGESDTL